MKLQDSSNNFKTELVLQCVPYILDYKSAPPPQVPFTEKL
jgi:hypothetical protein